MVNDEHYARLKKDVEAWNEWRQKNPKIIIDLMEANLMEANLMEANLSGANLSGANLMDANLSGANLRKANLSGANLMEANLSGIDLRKIYLKEANLREVNLSGANLSWLNLSGATLTGIDLSDANLTGANLSRSDLSEANLTGANLSRANLSGATFTRINLSEANLSGVNLSGADLRRTLLKGANLSGTNLTNADLSEATLSEANLSRANLNKANLSDAILSDAILNGANLSRTQVFGTDFTSAKFTGVCLEDWSSNSATKLNNIDCQYYFQKNDEQERRPSSGKYAPGDFTKLIQKALETVDLIFTDGIDWKAFLLSFQELQAEYGEDNISVQAFEKKSGNAFVVRLEVLPETNKAEIECRIKELYEVNLNAIEEIYRKELQAKDEQIIIYKEQSASIMSLAKEMAAKATSNIITVTTNAENISVSESYQSKYDQRNSNNQFIDTAQSGSNPKFNQYNYTPQQRQNLAEAAVEIQQLLQQLEQTNPTTSTSEKMTVVVKAIDEIEKNPTLKARIIGALKSGGTEALKEAIDHPFVNILMASIEGWQEAE